VKYCIIHVNDRAKDNIDYNKNILSSFEYIADIEFFNGNTGNAWDVLNNRGIKLDVWNPYDGRTMPPLPGELGIWVSTINTLEYIVNNQIEKMLVLEDDIKLQPNFIDMLDLCIKELPNGFDFLSLYYFDEQNDFTKLTDIGSKIIHKSNNQYSAGQAILYSLSGAKKILKLVRRKGIEYTTDCFIFKQSHIGLIDGYSIIPNNLLFLEHENKSVISIIDPKNTRQTQ